VIDAFEGAKTLERTAVPHQAELAVAVRAVVFHCLLAESCPYRPVQDEHHAIAVYCNAPLVLQPNIANWLSQRGGIGRRSLARDGKGRHAHPFASGPNIAAEAFVRLIAP
jgi:hypothetical protein